MFVVLVEIPDGLVMILDPIGLAVAAADTNERPGRELTPPSWPATVSAAAVPARPASLVTNECPPAWLVTVPGPPPPPGWPGAMLSPPWW